MKIEEVNTVKNTNTKRHCRRYPVLLRAFLFSLVGVLSTTPVVAAEQPVQTMPNLMCMLFGLNCTVSSQSRTGTGDDDANVCQTFPKCSSDNLGGGGGDDDDTNQGSGGMSGNS